MPKNRTLPVLGVLLVAVATVVSLTAVPDKTAGQPPPSARPLHEDDVARLRMEQSAIAAPSVTQPAQSTARLTVDVSGPSSGGWSIQGHVGRGLHGSYPNVPLVVHLYSGFDESGDLLEEARIRSDGEGGFAWTTNAPMETVTVRVVPDLENHYAVAATRVIGPGDPPPTDLRPYVYLFDGWVHGRVVDHEGSGIAAARVISHLSEVASDEGGCYSLRMASEYSSSTIRAVAPGYAEGVVAVGGIRPGDVTGPDLVLRREYAVRGRVIDEHEAPVAGATVCTYPRKRNQTTTDAKGRFRLGSLDPQKERTRVSALMSGFVTASVRVEPDSAETELELVLMRGASLSGRVVTEDGRPIAGAQVSVGYLPSSSGGQTDELGAFSLDVVPEGSNRIWALRQGWAPGRIAVDVPGSGGSVGGLEIVLRSGFVLAGVVLDQDDRPMHGAQIFPDSTGVRGVGYVGSHKITGADGRFVLDDLCEQEVLLTVWAEGCSRLEEVVTANRSDLVLRPQEAGRLAGRVIDGAAGEPVDSFVIRFVAPHLEPGVNRLSHYGAEWSQSGVSFVGTNGYWESGSERLQMGAVTGVEVSAHGYAVSVHDQAVVSAEPDADTLVVELHAGATLRGFVLNAASGSPIAGARVRRYTGGDPDSFSRYILDPACEASTDANGRFELPRVPLGPMYLFVDETDLPLTIDGPFEVPLHGGTIDRSIEVGSGGRLVGHLLDGDGRPLEGETVSLRALDVPDDDRPRETTTTDAEGTYSFDGLVPGQYHLSRVLTRGGKSVGNDLLRLVNIEDNRTLEFDLRPEGQATLRGMVEFEGELPEYMSVTLIPKQAYSHWAQRTRGGIVEDGTFVVSHLAAGEWSVQVHAQVDGQLLHGGAQVELPSEGTADVSLTLKPLRRRR